MRSVSVENAFQWTQGFIAREWRLLTPVAFAFMALPALVLELPYFRSLLSKLPAPGQTADMAAVSGAMGRITPVLALILLFGAYGGLTIAALALNAGISVRESLGLALRRLLVLVGCLVLIIAGQLAVGIVMLLLLGVARIGPAGIQSLLFVFLIGLSVYIGVRMFPLTPMIVRRRIGPISALRETWILTRGAFWPIFAAAAVYLVGAMVVMLASASGVGAILLMLGKAAGVPELAAALNAVFGQAVAALVALGFHVLAAAIFRQLDGSIRDM